MTTKWLTGATAATLFAGMTLAPITPAAAEPNKNPAADYSKCVGDYLVSHHWDVNTSSEHAALAAFDCCIDMGWQWVGTYPAGYCNVPNTSYGDPGQTGGPVVPPSGTAVIPPNAGQTELGPAQPAPAPTAALPPGANTRAGIQ